MAWHMVCVVMTWVAHYMCRDDMVLSICLNIVARSKRDDDIARGIRSDDVTHGIYSDDMALETSMMTWHM